MRKFICFLALFLFFNAFSLLIPKALSAPNSIEIPEPSTKILLGIALLILAGVGRKKHME